MSERDDGGSAFPLPAGSTPPGRRGMTMRDYFAAQVLNGFIVRYGMADKHNHARDSYAIADAMLEARKK